MSLNYCSIQKTQLLCLSYIHKTERVSLLLMHSQFWADLHKIWHVASLYPPDGHRVLVSSRRHGPCAQEIQQAATVMDQAWESSTIGVCTVP